MNKTVHNTSTKTVIDVVAGIPVTLLIPSATNGVPSPNDVPAAPKMPNINVTSIALPNNPSACFPITDRQTSLNRRIGTFRI